VLAGAFLEGGKILSARSIQQHNIFKNKDLAHFPPANDSSKPKTKRKQQHTSLKDL